ncbi:aminotransferase class I/II-fold pyridoxal phosphate-dependent enzyme [Flavilitoribacter nigricans]|uniref:GDP-perosamine synthase n=1 Tax=Flavilitoribacter nigricans (strain ATCC 23147 / DSM 23189 / NBRC 102662 / NCIMB 1420 / SS-2) TaxID=1122177 RepID=A0A2D0MZC3_FLAN2|nr:pyridoxal phosphate-dependent aminotransferase [Flavilitoribacter nigricans DSM 23189 = NBRC 102662]
MSGREENYVKEAFDTNWIAPLGPHVNGFEADLTTYTGAKAAAALSSGTAALHLALILADVGPGDTVICQSMTFAASANPIAYQGAEPVFIDSETETWNMDPQALEDALRELDKKGKRPKAIIPVHLYGMPAKMTEILEIARSYEVPVIEDAAEALGSYYRDQACGALGELSILSFNGNKIITTSGGGALLGNDEELIQRARFLATQARDPAPHYQHSQIGYNYRLSNVLAGIGRGQMEVLDKRVAQRRANFERYRSYFKNWENAGFRVQFQEEPKEVYSNRWLSCILLESEQNHGVSREAVRLALEAENIEARPLWKPMHLQPVFKDALYFGGHTAENLFNTGLCLPSGSNLTETDFDRIFAVLDQIAVSIKA